MANIIPSSFQGGDMAAPRPGRSRGGDRDQTDNTTFWIGFTLMTLISVGAGVLLATQVADQTRSRVLAEVAEREEQFPEGPAYAANMRLKDLKPIVTNLSAPADAWVRVQASIILNDDIELEQLEVLSSRIEEDMIAFLRTLTITHLEGSVALQHLREDLNERAKTRSEGLVKEVILESLVIQ